MSKVRVRYRTIEFGNSDINVRTLRDRQQYSDDDNVAEKIGISSANWPLFGVIWDSRQVLAQLNDGKKIPYWILLPRFLPSLRADLFDQYKMNLPFNLKLTSGFIFPTPISFQKNDV